MNIKIGDKEYEFDVDKAEELGLLKSKNVFVGRLEEYWYVDGFGTVQCESDMNDEIDDELFKLCNYFSTEEEAQLASDKTFDIWFKIRVWAIKNDAMKEFRLENINYYPYYSYKRGKWETMYDRYDNHGQTFMTEEKCKELVEILNNGNYKIK